MEDTKISGVAKDSDIARIALIGLKDEPGTAFKIFRVLAKSNINVDIILQSVGGDDTKEISFTVAKADMDAAVQALNENKAVLGFKDIDVSDKFCKISIVGAGMIKSPGIAARMFEALYEANVNIHMISTSEIKISVLIDVEHAEMAMQSIHKKFFGV
jgi:aspartate kinase